MWNPLEALKKKIGGEAAPEKEKEEKDGMPAAMEALKELKEAAKDAEADGKAPDPGMMAKFFRHWKNPAMLKQIRVIVGRMQADGVNVKDRKAVEEWLKAHQKEIESGEIANAPAAPKGQTFVKTAPEIGRNDPCPCGSGKKYKKCCEGKK